VLQHGFPREASIAVEIGGVRTNFRMPDVFSFGLGGGSLVRGDDELTIGPDSVGYELTKRARVFGGDDLTATDLAVAAGLAGIGDPARVAGLDRALVDRGVRLIEAEIAEAVDRMKTSAGDIPVVVVGGGSILIGDSLPGASEVVKPEHFAVANAIGAAIAQIGGKVDRVFSLEQIPREEALQRARDEATEKAVAAGASAGTVQIVDVEEVPLAYLPSNATRIHVKAVGDLELGREIVAPRR
jgi:N-methylhydantoinase A/oxoprolinase/acetone carboxylase beta subunit